VVLSRSFVFRLPLGILRAQCVAPQLKSPDDERPSWAIPIEGKETFWRIESLRDTMDLAAQKPQTRLINVCDREADFFELFEEQRRNPCVDLLVPAKHNRGIIVDPFKLFEAVQQAPLQTKVQVQVPRQSARPFSRAGGALPTASTSATEVLFRQRSHRHLGDSCGGVLSTCRNQGCRVVPVDYRQ
jgi:hypothetical protein